MTTTNDRAELIERYRAGAAAVADAAAGITDDELDRRPPGDGEWTAREVIHHLADSESMAFIRLRRLIAEDEPLIQGYDEPEWARRLHYDRPIETSLAVLPAVRAASLQLLESLTEDEWSRTGRHSQSGAYSVERWLEIYAAHPSEHADQIRRARGGGDGDPVERSRVSVTRSTDASAPPGPATAGMDRRLLAEDGDRWIGWVRVEPGVASGWHHHADRETYIFVVAGTMRIEFGPGGSDAVEGSRGDMIFVPTGAIHREVVISDEPADSFLIRIGPGPQVVNVDAPATV